MANKAERVVKQTIAIVDGGDWEGLFVDGELKAEGHRLQLHEVLRILGIEIVELEADEDWLGEIGSFPDKLSEVKLA